MNWQRMAELPPLEWFRERSVENHCGCWIWKAPVKRTPSGMWAGTASYLGHREVAYRASYRAAHGDFPPHLQIDHLCRNGRCVNPDHLEPVTHRENVLRSNGGGAVNARKTHCIRGHEFTPENTYVYTQANGRPARQCVACVSEARKRRRRAA